MKNLAAHVLVGIGLLGAAIPATQAATVQIGDFIGAAYTNFNGFESATVGAISTYTEGGIKVEEMPWPGGGSVGAQICGSTSGTNFQGTNFWCVPTGDLGYTRITMADGSDFVNLGFLAGSGYSTSYFYYELYNNGSLVQSGSVLNPDVKGQWLGFSDGGFDEVRVRESDFPLSQMTTPGASNTLRLDSIKATVLSAPVPLPAAAWLFLSGIAGLGALRRRKTR